MFHKRAECVLSWSDFYAENVCGLVDHERWFEMQDILFATVRGKMSVISNH